MGFAKELRRPNPKAKWCHKCQCWWVPFTTKVTQPVGWCLCSQCHDCPWSNDFSEIPWEQRRIRLLGVKGQAKYDKLHHLTLEGEQCQKITTKEQD